MTGMDVRDRAVIDAVAAGYRRQAWKMCKPVDPTGAWYKPVMHCAIQLFDAANELDGWRDEDEPTRASVDEAVADRAESPASRIVDELAERWVHAERARGGDPR